MKAAASIVVGWLLPGGGYLLARRYRQFALFLGLICTVSAVGVMLHGSNLWPRAEDLQGLDGFTARIAQAGALTKYLAGGPSLVAAIFDPTTYAQGRTHEYGTTLLSMAGLLNVLAIADARR